MQTEAKKTFFRNFIFIASFYLICGSVIFLYERFFSAASFLSPSNFLNWDAMHYETIAREGYHTGMVAFFPLFPYTWGLLNFSATGIALFNGFLFILSFAWLAGSFTISRQNMLILCSIPSLIFMFLPFSEAFFFASGAAALIGFKKENNLLTGLGIFFAGLSRPVATLFIPALLLVFFFSEKEKQTWKKLILPAVLSLASFLLVLIMQRLQTGEWFTFFKVQKDWNNYLRIPVFPLSSWSGGFIVRLDAIAFFVCLVAFGNLVYLWMKKNRNKKNEIAVVFSLAYLSTLGFLVLCTRGGMLNSLNRYAFATPFFFIAFNEVLNGKMLTSKNLLWLFLSSSACWLLFGSYVHIQAVLKFELLSIFLCVIFCYQSGIKWLHYASLAIILAVNIFFMEVFYQRFLTGGWVG